MITVTHRFADHLINPETETLIIGTFNPETPTNTAEFFYGRSRNHLWRLLPTAFGEENLKGSTLEFKKRFISRYKIDFTDLIKEIQVDEGQEANYDDSYLDSRVTQWKKIIEIIENLPRLKRVCFTRKSFSDIPNMKLRIEVVAAYCDKQNIYFKSLTTPARFYREDKQIEWTEFLLSEIEKESTLS